MQPQSDVPLDQASVMGGSEPHELLSEAHLKAMPGRGPAAGPHPFPWHCETGPASSAGCSCPGRGTLSPWFSTPCRPVPVNPEP